MQTLEIDGYNGHWITFKNHAPVQYDYKKRADRYIPGPNDLCVINDDGSIEITKGADRFGSH